MLFLILFISQMTIPPFFSYLKVHIRLRILQFARILDYGYESTP